MHRLVFKFKRNTQQNNTARREEEQKKKEEKTVFKYLVSNRLSLRRCRLFYYKTGQRTIL